MDLQTVLKQLENCQLKDAFGTRKEIASLPEILNDDEVIQYATSGTVDGNTVFITLTQKRILFIDKGMLYGIRSTEIPLDMVNGVSYSKGLVLGKIAVTNGANTIVIDNIAKETCPIMADKIKNVSEKYKQSLKGNNATSSAIDDNVIKAYLALHKETNRKLDKIINLLENLDR